MSRSTPIAFRIFDAFFRHIWLFLIALVVVSGVTMTALLLRSQTYHATALTQIVTQDVAAQLGMSSEGNAWTSPAQQNVDHFNDLLNDDLPGGFLDLALQQANLKQSISFDSAATPDPRLAELRKNLYVTALDQTTYAIGLTWDNKTECSTIVQAFQTQYIKEVGIERATSSTATTSFLDSEIAADGKQLAATEKVLIEYRTLHPDELPEAQSADISQLSSLRAQLDNMRISQHDAAMKRQALLTRIAQVKPMSIMEQDTGQSPMQTQINQLKAERDSMLAGNMLPTHPEVVNLTDRIDTLQAQMQTKAKTGASEATGAISTKLQENPEYQALQQQLMDANIAQQTQQAQTALIQQEIAHYNDVVTKIPFAQKTLANVTQNYAFVKAQYENMLNLRAQAQLKGNLDSVTASSSFQPIGAVYAEPTTGTRKMWMMLAGCIVLGMVVGIIAVVLSEWSDHSFRYATDMERLLGVPVLGTVRETQNVWAPGLPGGRSPRRLAAPGVPNGAAPRIENRN